MQALFDLYRTMSRFVLKWMLAMKRIQMDPQVERKSCSAHSIPPRKLQHIVPSLGMMLWLTHLSEKLRQYVGCDWVLYGRLQKQAAIKRLDRVGQLLWKGRKCSIMTLPFNSNGIWIFLVLFTSWAARSLLAETFSPQQETSITAHKLLQTFHNPLPVHIYRGFEPCSPDPYICQQRRKELHPVFMFLTAMIFVPFTFIWAM